jgi:hypothetical protein
VGLARHTEGLPPASRAIFAMCAAGAARSSDPAGPAGRAPISRAGAARADAPNPPGGEILKDQAGRPIGVFRETAAGLIDQALANWQAAKTPEQRAADAKRTMDLAIEEAFSKGVTSFQDAGASFETVADALRTVLAEEGHGGGVPILRRFLGGKVVFVDYHRPSRVNPFRYVMVPILKTLEPLETAETRDTALSRNALDALKTGGSLDTLRALDALYTSWTLGACCHCL